ncbi:hypothetical protein, partial [Candidatus Magnetaquicoccus inordinatus]|uniref:hypothetical protein n=1 Tax=Candidatus Magnetaquicoccus inordinatus TaxID=2496818 RepID=UPI001D0DCFC2
MTGISDGLPEILLLLGGAFTRCASDHCFATAYPTGVAGKLAIMDCLATCQNSLVGPLDYYLMKLWQK